ncbi:NAD-specific glutamate dehydrogenase [Natrinema pallidum DSM 3751]|uniref:NAD-specific glutamate dehydrogenase n=1 Tax=Natrinema pallidum DSM 3751 TaxID=1227495 RepID=L9Z1A9_9EURY|nr:NAD-specific glutamate dehydrogenase [Natrinema pallidum DSM 3751]
MLTFCRAKKSPQITSYFRQIGKLALRSYSESATRTGRLLLVVVLEVDVLEVRIDELLVLAAGSAGFGAGVRTAAHAAHSGTAGTCSAACRTASAASCTGTGLLLVDLLADLLQLLAQGFGCGLDVVGVGFVVVDRLLEILDRALDVGAEIVVDLLVVLLEQRFRALDRRLGGVTRFDALALLLVFLGVFLGLFLHLLDLFVGETGTAFDGDLLGGAAAFVLRRDVDDAVLVDREGHLDLWRASGGWRDSGQVELAEQFVLFGQFALALEDPDLYRGLVVRCGGEHLRLLGRNRRVLLDESFEESPFDLDTERQRRDVEQDDVVDLAAQNAALNRRAQRDGLVGVDVLLGLLADEFLDLLGDLRHPGRPTDQEDLVDVVLAVVGVLECLLGWLDRTVDEIAGERFELRAGQRLLEVDRTVVGRRDERQVDLGLLARGEFDLGLFGGVFQPLEGLPVLVEVDPVFGLELVGEVVDDGLVPVVAAEIVVTVGRDDLVDAAAEIENRDVEGAAAEVVDEHGLVGIVVEAVGHRRGGRLVDDALDLEAGDLAGVFGRLALSVGEVRRDRDDGLFDLVAEIVLGVAFDLLEDHRRDLLGRILLTLDLDGVVLFTDVALDRRDRLFGVLDRLVLRRFPDEPLVVGKGDDGGRRPFAFGVDDNLRIAAFHHRERAVRRPQVDSENFVARHRGRVLCALCFKGY